MRKEENGCKFWVYLVVFFSGKFKILMRSKMYMYVMVPV